MISTCLLIAALLVAGADVPVSARAELDAAEIPFHRVAHYRVIVDAPADAVLAVEPWGESLPGLRVTTGESSEISLPDGRKQLVQAFTLTPSIVMSYTLPATRVMANGAEVAVVEPLALVVRTLTPEEKAEVSAPAALYTLADLEHLGSSGRGRAVGLGAIIVLVAALLVVFATRGLRRWNARPVPTPVEVAEAELAALEQALQSGVISCDAFYVALSQLLRIYLGTSFDPAVAGQSTPEFLAETLPGLPLDPAHSGSIRDMLGAFDRVKFAQYSPDREGQARELRAVRNLIAALENEASRRAEQALRGAA
ncbi:MAG: hypothetical protein JNK74_10835 [Candidatus Hydrogenedentes bacterium]|nr:hypothetical protein [Candidatus Hydrogenedentota bacterium]